VTVAICIKCGERKHGALTVCPRCRFDPTDTVDRAKSMIVTDHFLSVEDLHGIGERIRSGQSVTYPQDAIDEYAKLFKEQDAKKFPMKAKYFISALCIAAVIGFICFTLFGT
jgi:hypothetical protein